MPESTLPNIQITSIPDQVISAGKEFIFDVSSYFVGPENEVLEYFTQGNPSELLIDPSTGIIRGIAPNPEINRVYDISIFVSGALQPELQVENHFKLTVIGTALAQSQEAQAFFGGEQPGFNFWNAAQNWEVALFVQQLLNEHFVYVMIFNGDNPPESIGKEVMTRTAKCGWMIRHYDNCVVIAPGDMAFAEYGNRGRLIATLEETFINDVPSRNWTNIALFGSDAENVGKAWVVGKRLGFPVAQYAPNDAAEYNFQNIERMLSGGGKGGLVPTP